MIARTWRGVVKRDDAEEYAKYIRGDNIEAAVLYPEDERYLIGDSTVAHYEVVDDVAPPGAPG